jgi:hypothetical protein
MTFSWNVKFVPMWDHICIYQYIYNYVRKTILLSETFWTVLYIYITYIYINDIHSSYPNSPAASWPRTSVQRMLPKDQMPWMPWETRTHPHRRLWESRCQGKKIVGQPAHVSIFISPYNQCPIVRSIPM